MATKAGVFDGAPSEIEYQLVRRHYDGNGVSNEVFGTRVLRVWAIAAILEPVTTTRIDNRIINPCGIVIGLGQRLHPMAVDFIFP